MMKKNKGQGALEYLLLIGGAVLIAVIVIALLVGMGGQSRETANTQAENAQQSLDMPQPASIVNVSENQVSGCVSIDLDVVDGANEGRSCKLNLNWQELGDSGTYTFKLYDYKDDLIYLKDVAFLSTDNTNNTDNILNADDISAGATFVTQFSLSTSNTMYVWIPIAENPQDSFWGEITTEKNGKFATSVKYKISWS